MKKTKFTLYEKGRPRIAYTVRGKRKFITLDGVPLRKVHRLVTRANTTTTQRALSRFMSRSLGYTAGEFSETMFTRLMVKRIKQIKADARLSINKRIARAIHSSPRAPQFARNRNLFADFVSKAAGLCVIVEKMEGTEPPASWRTEKLDEFLENTRPLKTMIERVELLAKEKQTMTA